MRMRCTVGRARRAGCSEPIAADQPCGENLEDTPLLASFDAFRLFGRTKPLEPGPESGMARRRSRIATNPPDWGEIKNRALEALARARISGCWPTGHRAAANRRPARLRRDAERRGAVARELLDDDVSAGRRGRVLRRSALNCFADPMAVVDAAAAAPLVSSRQHGTFSLRDIEIAGGQLRPRDGDARPDESQINAAFAALPLDELTALQQGAAAGAGCAEEHRREDARDAAPRRRRASNRCRRSWPRSIGSCAARSRRAERRRSEADAGDRAARAAGMPAVRRRDPVAAGCDPGARAVAEFFRRNEPSSPVPLFCRPGEAVWCRRIFSKCWQTLRPTRSVRRARRADVRQAIASECRLQEVCRGQGKQSEVHRPKPGAARADRVRRRALRRGEEDSAAVRDGRAGRFVGQARRAAAAGRRSQVPRDRRRQLRQPDEGDEAAGRVPGAEHADRRRQPQRRADVREHGRFLTRRGCAQGRCAQQAARGAAAAVEPDYVYGRQERRGGARQQAAAGSCPAADAGGDQEGRRKNAGPKTEPTRAENIYGRPEFPADHVARDWERSKPPSSILF